mmetsp:Transcript_63675/g.113699  ORF Transcript_63675/g.113699 Transcript_63675/m.113699 type:complete len:80 (+) Transcript_63675:259-498(+)
MVIPFGPEQVPRAKLLRKPTEFGRGTKARPTGAEASHPTSLETLEWFNETIGSEGAKLLNSTALTSTEEQGKGEDQGWT